MRRTFAVAAIIFGVQGAAGADTARTLCTLVADTRGNILLQEGEGCSERVTPASTFKVTLAAIGYDAAILKDRDEPVLPFRKGYPDWVAAWKQPTGPAGWMQNSVLWYSQEIARRLGIGRLEAYVASFGYGNADMSGDPGRNNALERAWISSSLAISPREQAAFLARLVTGRLPISEEATRRAMAIVERHEVAGGAVLAGKTGSAYPRRADGSLDRARGWGWYVGWTDRDGRRLVFAHLRQDTQAGGGPGGLRARADFLSAWPGITARLP
jgi:beta-lactamase class D